MGFTLVYAGERYVVDELAVIAIALLAWSERLASLPQTPGARSGFPGPSLGTPDPSGAFLYSIRRAG